GRDALVEIGQFVVRGLGIVLGSGATRGGSCGLGTERQRAKRQNQKQTTTLRNSLDHSHHPIARIAAVRDRNDFTARNAAFGMRNYTRAAAADTFENFIGSIYFSDAKKDGCAFLMNFL